jgi:pSer/pThr/pTyr-binding forkhead associated (FHA) protein/tetratricopeptide (TPR) repeat protein
MADDVTLEGSLPSPLLVVRVGGRVTQKVPLQAEVTIGRAEENDLCLAEPKVSRHHARVVKEGHTFVLTDLGSANGTLVNGIRLTAPHTLRHGERIAIGDAELTYQESGAAGEDTLAGPVLVPAPPAPSEPEGERRNWVMVAILAAAAVLIVVGGVTLVVLAPDVLEQIGLVSPATPTSQAEEATPVGAAGTPAGAAGTPVQAVGTPTAVAGTAIAMETPVEAPSPTVEVLTPVASPITSTEFDELMTQAEALTRRSKFEEAVAVYEELARRAPEDARVEVGWAWALILDDEGEEALVHARRAAELDPESADAAAVLARAYVETGDRDEALAAAQEAVELDSGSAQARAALAEAYRINDQTQEAVDEADLALVQDSQNANAHRVRGWLYREADGDMGSAAGELQIAAGLQPELWLRRHELGLLLLEAEDYSTALLAFQDALGLRPKAVTYTAIGRAYYELGEYDQAKASLQQALETGAEDLETYALMAAACAYRGRCEDAEDYYQQALALDPSDPLALEAKDLCEGEGPLPSPSPTTAKPPSPTPVLTAQPSRQPTRAPAALSGRIAFPVWNKDRGKYDIYVANADGGGRRLVTEEMHQPAFRPDGSWLAANGERHEHMNLHIVRPDGSGLKEITENIEDGLPAWSPDGSRLVFSSTKHGDRQSRIYVLDQVPFVGRKEGGRPLNFGPDDVRGEYPAWASRDRIVFKGCDNTVEPVKCGLFIMPSAPGPHPMEQLTENLQDTAPAAHGSKIAFMSDRDGNWEVYVMNDDGSGVKRLTNDSAHDGLPTWSPDGRTIAFVSNKGGAWAVWAMGPDGSNRRKLFDFGGGGLALEWQNQKISWGP